MYPLFLERDMKVIKSTTIGYCHGVAYTLKMAERCIEKGLSENVPFYCIGELIHNRDVVRSVEERGMRIIRKPSDCEDDSGNHGEVGLTCSESGKGYAGSGKNHGEVGLACSESGKGCARSGKNHGEAGLACSENGKDCAGSGRKIALIRAHGIEESLKKDFQNAGFELFDATCTNIKTSVSEIKKASSVGREVIVVGVKKHAETLCLMGIENTSPHLVSGREELPALFAELSSDIPVTVIVQTTFLESEFNAICLQLKNYYKDIIFANRLCPDCIHRKQDLLELSRKCRAIVVSGGKKSENTSSLAKYAEEVGLVVFRVENVNDFDEVLDEEILRYGKVGLCSGTSTPMSVIDKICAHLEAL